MNISFFRFGSDPSRYVLRLGDYHTEERDDFERTLSPERIEIHRKYHSQGWEIVWPLTRTLMRFAFRLGATGGARGLSPVSSPAGELQ
ncbi:hypothetical protein M9458_026740, partial [Cirrhinus mrigala]